jgi:hypothetical protein
MAVVTVVQGFYSFVRSIRQSIAVGIAAAAAVAVVGSELAWLDIVPVERSVQKGNFQAVEAASTWPPVASSSPSC